jgi:hypothetical protein
MGVINLDSIDTSYGASVANTYASLSNGNINIDGDENGWWLNGSFTVWLSKGARDSGKSPVDRVNIRKKLSTSNLSQSVFTLAYDELKLQLTNTQDSL